MHEPLLTPVRLAVAFWCLTVSSPASAQTVEDHIRAEVRRYVEATTFPLNVQYVDWFTDAERRARAEGRGLWAIGGFECRPVDRRQRRCD
jgi:hypothetical protein